MPIGSQFATSFVIFAPSKHASKPPLGIPAKWKVAAFFGLSKGGDIKTALLSSVNV